MTVFVTGKASSQQCAISSEVFAESKVTLGFLNVRGVGRAGSVPLSPGVVQGSAVYVTVVYFGRFYDPASPSPYFPGSRACSVEECCRKTDNAGRMSGREGWNQKD